MELNIFMTTDLCTLWEAEYKLAVGLRLDSNCLVVIFFKDIVYRLRSKKAYCWPLILTKLCNLERKKFKQKATAV